MWLCFSDSFLSIVAKDCPADSLLVRARRKEHITSVFPGATVTTKDGTDYQFRAVIKRSVVAQAVAAEIESISYDNFKDTVVENKLHTAFSRIWHVMASLQPKPPYSSYSGRGAGRGRLL